MALPAEHPGPDGTAEPAGRQDSPAPPAAPVPAPALPGAQLPHVSSSPYPPQETAQHPWSPGHQRGPSIRGPLAHWSALSESRHENFSLIRTIILPTPTRAIKILLPCLPPSPSRRLPLLSLELPCSCRAGQTIGCFREIHFWANLPCISVSLTL